MDTASHETLPIVAVNAIILSDDNRVLLTRRMDNGIWCLPGGLVEYGETVSQAVVRELREEIGVECEVNALVGVYSANNKNITAPNGRCSIILAFRCQILQGTPTLSDEVSKVAFFAPEHLPPLIENHRVRIADALARLPTPVID